MSKSDNKQNERDMFSIDDQVGHLLRLAYQRASAHLAERIRPYDLTPVQFATLMRLLEHGPLSQNQLGRLVSMPPANIHSLIGRLKKRNLVETNRSPDDKRLLVISLSATGRALGRKLIPLDQQSSEDALSPLTKAEREMLPKILRKLI